MDRVAEIAVANTSVSKTALIVALIVVAGSSAFAQSQTAGEFWPELDAHFQLADEWRLLGFVGSKKGEDFPYQQLNTGLAIGRQWRKFTKPHPENIDPDKEHTLVFGGGYEYLQTVTGKPQSENRVVLQGMPGFRPRSWLLLRDRNRVEFRWVNGVYSTRYRNYAYGECDLAIRKFRFSPYASAEFFYDGATSSWNQKQYAAGIQWPYKRVLQVDTYYLRQNCTTCSPIHLNVGGLTLSLFF